MSFKLVICGMRNKIGKAVEYIKSNLSKYTGKQFKAPRLDDKKFEEFKTFRHKLEEDYNVVFLKGDKGNTVIVGKADDVETVLT